MFIVDDILVGLPVGGVKWVLRQIHQAVEREATNEQPVMQAILENEMAFEEGRYDKATYEANQEKLMGQLRAVRELKKQLAEERAAAAAAAAGVEPPAATDQGPGKKAISGPAKLEVDLDFGGYGK